MIVDRRRILALAEHVSVVFMSFGLLGLISAALLAGVVYGVAIGRRHPDIYSLEIIGPTHAGGDMRVREKVRIPDDCIPRIARKLATDPFDKLHSGPNLIQVVTDAAVVGQGDILIPLSRDVPVGHWRYYETVSTEGCGVISGILAPLIADAHDTSGRLGVAIDILPMEPLPAIPVH